MSGEWVGGWAVCNTHYNHHPYQVLAYTFLCFNAIPSLPTKKKKQLCSRMCSHILLHSLLMNIINERSAQLSHAVCDVLV